MMEPGRLDVVVAKSSATPLVCAGQELEATPVFSAGHSHLSDRPLERRLTSWIILQAVHRALGFVEEARDPESVAARMLVWIRALEETGEDSEDVFGADALAFGAVALSRGAARLDGGRRAETEQ
jgi:hypothetical protein